MQASGDFLLTGTGGEPRPSSVAQVVCGKRGGQHGAVEWSMLAASSVQ